MWFMAVVGWLRVVCSNGMVVQEKDSYYRRRHNQYLEMSGIAAVLQVGIAATPREQTIYKAWRAKKVSKKNLENIKGSRLNS
jgi:hypothetical protein